MDCDRIRPLLPRLVDGELGPLRRRLVSYHLARCPECAVQFEDLLTMQRAIRTNLPFYRAPPSLAARIGNMLPEEAAPPVRRRRFAGLAMAGGGACAGALAGVALTFMVLSGPSSDPLARAVIGSHVRSLMVDHLTDVPTSDRHTVKPWLSAHLDVSPPVRDLVADGFPLVGGRLDYIDGHPAAAVVYRHDKHVINLFAWADTGDADAGFHLQARQGFNLVSWRRGGVAYCAISDLEADQLEAFARLAAAG